MIKIDNLQNSIYSESLFVKASDNPVVEEKQVEAGKLKRVTLATGANQVISCSINYLKETNGANRKLGNALFRGMCDAFYLLEKDGKNYIVAVEMKSQVVTKAASQIIASMIKYKQMLTTYSSFLSEEYKEVGIFISQNRANGEDNPDKTSSKSHRAVMVKKMDLSGTYCEDWLRRLSHALENKGSVTVNMKGSLWDGIDMNSYLKQPFTIYHKKVEANCEYASVDISELLQ